jgi:heme exporter protein A
MVVHHAFSHPHRHWTDWLAGGREWAENDTGPRAVGAQRGVFDDVSIELETKYLTKVFGQREALRGVDLKVASGEFLTIVGPNGAGKSTLLRCFAGLTKPSTGQVLLRGHALDASAAELRRHIGLLSHETFLYDDLTAAENLRFYGRMYDVDELDSQIERLLRALSLYGRAHDPVRTYSRGMQQRLAIARVLLHQPSVILMDEPYTGLDQQAAENLGQMLMNMAGGRETLIMTTHHLEPVLQVGSRLAIMVEGRVVYDARKPELTLSELSKLYREKIGVGR